LAGNHSSTEQVGGLAVNGDEAAHGGNQLSKDALIVASISRWGCHSLSNEE